MQQSLIRHVLFVCTGNICRSPLAEAVMRHKITQNGLDVICDSAGTHDYHVGERPDPRTLEIARQYGVGTEGIVARQVKTPDFGDFDLILAMDSEHLRHLQRICPPSYQAKIQLFDAEDIPDPYYGDFSGFEDVYRRVENGCNVLISKHFQI